MKQTLTLVLRRWRSSARLTQAQAADRLGRSLRTVQDWEQGRSAPRGQALTLVLRQIDKQTNEAKIEAVGTRIRQRIETAMKGGRG